MVKKVVLPFAPSLLAMALVLACAAVWGGTHAVSKGEFDFRWLSMGGLAVALGAFFCEYIDSTLGMGYGTTLTPVLLLAGFKPLDIVPAVLLSELFTGLVGALAHHRAGNVSLKPGSRHMNIALVLGVCSVAGTLAAVFVALSIPKFYLKLYIGVLVLLMGVIILFLRNRTRRFSWRKIVGLGVLASFNKGMSGGGYGPVVTGGQILSGVEGKGAIGITSFAEGLTCLVGVTAYCATKGGMAWDLAAPLALGALASVPFAAWSVRRISTARLTLAIGIVTTLLGLLTLWKVLF